MSVLDKIKPPDDPHPGVRISLPEEPRLPAPTRVTIARVDIPFGDLVMLLVKVTIAAIPAGLIILTLAAVLAVGLGMFGVIFDKLGK